MLEDYIDRIQQDDVLSNFVDGQVLLHTKLNEYFGIIKTAVNANFYDIQDLEEGIKLVGNSALLDGASLSRYAQETLQEDDNKVPSSMQVKIYADAIRRDMVAAVTELRNIDTGLQDQINDINTQISDIVNSVQDLTSNVLTKDNTELYVPTGPYNPATKDYVDNNGPTVSVGSTTTLEPGSEALVTNSGTSRDAVFEFSIPRGEQGIQGIQGEQGIQGIQGPQGIQGEIGPEGPQGIQGIQGEEGPQGPQGIQGIQGIQGERGQDGTSVTFKGYYDTLEELQAAHPTGSAGDAYIVGDSLYVWDETDAQWTEIGVIRGPEGRQGEQGVQGPEGPAGPQGEQGIQGIQGEPGEPGRVQELLAGAGIVIDNTDPTTPVITATSTGELPVLKGTTENPIIICELGVGIYVMEGVCKAQDFSTQIFSLPRRSVCILDTTSVASQYFLYYFSAVGGDNAVYIQTFNPNTGTTAAGGSLSVSNLVTLSSAQTITGLKTFNVLPQSSVVPTNDVDLVTKSYVDEIIDDVDGVQRLVGTSTNPIVLSELESSVYVISGYVRGGQTSPIENWGADEKTYLLNNNNMSISYLLTISAEYLLGYIASSVGIQLLFETSMLGIPTQSDIVNNGVPYLDASDITEPFEVDFFPFIKEAANGSGVYIFKGYFKSSQNLTAYNFEKDTIVQFVTNYNSETGEFDGPSYAYFFTDTITLNVVTFRHDTTDAPILTTINLNSVVGSSNGSLNNMVYIARTAYDVLAVKDSKTVYYIDEEN